MNIGSFCSGYGGLEMGVVAALGGTVVWHAEIDPAASAVLEAHYDVPNHGDLTTIDFDAIEAVDALCAGFPCQPVSMAGQRKVTDDARWLWPHIAHAVRVLRPRTVVLENVSGLLAPWRDGSRWAPAPIEEVLGDLAAVGYDAQWRSVRASDVGAPHRRHRVFIVAHADPDMQRGRGEGHAFAGDGVPAPLRRGATQHRGRRSAAPDTDGASSEARRGHDTPGARDTGRQQPVDRGGATADADEFGRQGAQPQPRGHLGGDVGRMDWGPYAGAIARWEHIIGRPAPAPVDDRRRLSPRFVEWMMGLPEGWVTDIPVARTAQLKILGNGVVPQQAAHAIGLATMAVAA